MDRLILASGSPRRKEILEKYNIKPIIVKSDIEEKISEGEMPEQIAMSLALHKALDVSKNYKNDIVIGADTIVVINGLILGKPANKEDAFNMLSMLSGKEHKVITGVALIKEVTNTKVIEYEVTKVQFRKLSEDKIENYILTGEPFDKAGAYAIQGIGAILVENIVGCYSNVVGLPLTKIDKLLYKYFDYKIL